MLTLSFTASVVKKDRGQYIAHAAEFPVSGEMASTQRGAVMKLRAAVGEGLYKAAESGTLTELLDDAGYTTELLGFTEFTLKSHVFDSDTVLVPIGRQLLKLNRHNRKPT